MDDHAVDAEWQHLYRFVRAQLFAKVVVQFEEPSELAQNQWDGVKMPEKADYEAIETALARSLSVGLADCGVVCGM